MIDTDLKPALKSSGLNLPNVPNVLYKYVGERTTNLEESLKLIQNEEIWLAYAKSLNDPFEGHSLYINEEDLKILGWQKKDIQRLMKHVQKVRENMLIGSLANSNIGKDLNLWAHYADEHKGFALAYEVIDHTYIYPVLYEEERYSGAEVAKKFREDFLIIWFSFIVKHCLWKDEKEYRILKYDQIPMQKDEKGKSFKEEVLGVRLKSIYIGEKCSCKKKIINLAKKRNCKVYQMKTNLSKPEFSLEKQRIY